LVDYWRPVSIGETGAALVGGPLRFAAVERIRRGEPAQIVGLDAVPAEVLARLTGKRAGYGGDLPLVMGILNVTPDSFSDGGKDGNPRNLVGQGADIVDVGAESTRPGAAEVSLDEEMRRLSGVLPKLSGVRWSVDTRKSGVMAAALDAGAAIVNDVSAMTHDRAALALVAARRCPVVLMHHQGEPQTMQAAPRYDDVLLDVYDWLAERIEACLAAGIARDAIIVDVGIGFGKTLAHNLALLRGLALFHGLGVPLLLGASRKRLIAGIAGAELGVEARLPGSLALALHGAAMGVQIVRVHDVAETVQALDVWRAAQAGRA
jgi:dihydropteroate synthase